LGSGPSPVESFGPASRTPGASSGTSRGGGEDAQSEHRACTPCQGGSDDREGRILSLEGSGPKAFGSTVHDARSPIHLRAPTNVVKYGNKTNPSVWLEDYHLACKVGGADDDLFII
jgi:hypothetical protein